ncbi:hypothetical protein AhnVgp095 [Adoxophyes honmai nucleopolyhedrovirus]|uniref:Per os infectivity factor 2 n=1 Tax=Adoxophyes honmai nucleopolyhedrovirus TaxID=224399 RepID=Q80LK1_NPVAH|nr:hypothetical protein AhnVgp095 [Adoxophyes honmai nucleopolyhedrovirus]BAC67346.1 hypothetical protein [Adoxophyes honmai nucleopolyhedrovirus]
MSTPFILIVVIIVLFLTILTIKPYYKAYNLIKHNQINYLTTLDENIDKINNVLMRRNYVPLNSLPDVIFNTDLGTKNDGDLKCLSVPIYVGIFETPNFDCTLVCDNPSAAYFYVGEQDKFVINGELLSKGGYCTTSSVPRNCNRETSVILLSFNQWTCLAEDPRYFSGTHNMTQVAGRQHINRIKAGEIDKNILFDKLLGMEVNVARNTFRSHWDELLPDGTRRFEMRCNARDNFNNQMFVNPFNPIECLPNVCTNVTNVHPTVKPNFITGECECGDATVTRLVHVTPGDRTSMCASVVDGFDRDLMSHQFRIECINLDLSVEHFSSNKLLCPPDLFTQNTDNAYTFTLPGSFPLSGNGIDEPTYRLYMETKNRVTYNTNRSIP